SDRQLRQFGLISSVGLPLAGWLLSGAPRLPWSPLRVEVYVGLLVLGVAAAIIGWLRPRWLKPVFLALSLAAFPIGLVVGEVVLALIYFVVFTPVALVFRLIGRDVLHRRFDRAASTYWQDKEQPKGASSYF